MEKPNEIASKLLDDWDIKHFGRCPIANGSFQYNTRVDLVSMIAQALREAEARGMEKAAQIAEIKCMDVHNDVRKGVADLIRETSRLLYAAKAGAQ